MSIVSPHADPGLRPELEPLPGRMIGLPVHRGYPVPWFVAWDKGEPEFRCMDGDKWRRAVNERRCWVCGELLGKFVTFVAGPMCGINRTSGEPPCHLECGRWSARNCPFLSKPQMERREGGIGVPKEQWIPQAGIGLQRNPGVTLLWTTQSYHLWRPDPHGPGNPGVLIEMGEPTSLEWWAEGKPATRAQVEASVASGLPALVEALPVELQESALAGLARRRAWLETKYPAQEPS